jgi:benzoate/toluate 1,2-dioxygenase beta subunit
MGVTVAPVAADPALLAELDDIVQTEARLLDAEHWGDWLGLYAKDGWYWVPHRPDQPNPQDEVSVFYDDRMLMETRVRRLEAASSHAQTPGTRSSRVVSRVRLESADADKETYVVSSKFVMLEHRIDEQKMWGGTYTHALRRNGEGWEIAWKRVDLVNADGVLDPISIPF